MSKYLFGWLFLVTILTAGGCKKFLDVDPPNSQIASDLVFNNDDNANSAVVGMYLDMYKGAFAGGGQGSLPWVAGLTADELHNNPQLNHLIIQFEQNQIDPSNVYIADIWTSMYKAIYQANAIIEGLNLSTGVSANKKKQLMAEALFIRAFSYFYLVNIYGDVPLVLTTDYHLNSVMARTSQAGVYNQIEMDLLAAENSVDEAYSTSGRVRPNRSTAQALLSRVYLYRHRWQEAEALSTKVIAKTGVYELATDLNSVFLATSREAIWQIKPGDFGSNTNEGVVFGIGQGPMSNVLTDKLINSFSAADKRKMNWVTNTGTVHLPYKYKLWALSSVPSTEYSTILRLAEQYLIRAEARAKQGKISGLNSALSDINAVRNRAGLMDTTATGLQEIIGIIARERYLELFSEWAHRWLDLKRWNRASEVLAPIRPHWNATDTLYPIPQKELSNNPYLKPQNPGY